MAEVEIVHGLPSQTLPEIKHVIQPEDIPLPRSSMVSVRLSDIPFDPELDIIAERGVSLEASLPESGPPSSRSSRSSSRTSESSISISSVNWEDLEKSEAQEAKDEADDEVGA